MSKARDTRDVPHPGNKIHIPLREDEALRLALQVKPTKDMPRPGASGRKLPCKQCGQSPCQCKAIPRRRTGRGAKRSSKTR